MFFGPLLFILLIIGIIFVFMTPNQSNRSNSCYANNSMPPHKPLDTLKERYAKGEISEEEFLRAKRNLE